MTSNFSLPPSNFSEASLVQQTTAEYLEQQLGWESVYAYNCEDFGPDSLLGRASDREVVLTRALRAKLVELNPDLPDEAYDDAVRQITATVASQTIVATNREKHDLARGGVQVTFRPHRRLIKEGIDLPEAMRSRPQFRNMQRMDLDEAFKEEEHPFRIAIVCTMWLTGFDVPSLSTLYLDKPLKAHTLRYQPYRLRSTSIGV